MTSAIKKQTSKRFAKLIETDFRPDEAIPKYYQIKTILKSCISKNAFSPGDQLPSADIISRQFRVTRVTVDKALAEMEREGLVNRIQGKGTFIACREDRLQREEIAGLFLHTKGHVYGDFTKHLVHNLHALGYYSLLFDTSLIEKKSERYEQEVQRVRNLLDMKLVAAIIDGFSLFPFETLLKARKKIGTLVFAFICETPDPFPYGVKVLIDYEEGGYQAVKHLLEAGHERIILLTYPPQEEPFFMFHSLFRGCKKAYSERGLDAGRLLTIVKEEPDRQVDGDLAKILSSRDRPTAAFCFGDSRARELFNVAKKLNLSIPEDIAVVGYYDTPWCWRFSAPLSSVSVREDEIAGHVTDILQHPGRYSDGDVIWVKPRLVVRESTKNKTGGAL